jgi:Glyoxalase/Bleomycin resistance protein/Dioxygenase superfamily
MGLVNFGQPDDGVIQMAYVVEDIQYAIQKWVTELNVGPWFLLDNFAGIDARYREQPTEASVSLAMSFAGHMMVELIQEHRPVPSVYRETIEKRGYGFHHWGIASKDFDRDLARYRASGYDLAFHARVPTGGRVAYMDTTADLPGMVELIELGAAFDPVFSGFYRASIGWDGRDPIRPFSA